MAKKNPDRWRAGARAEHGKEDAGACTEAVFRDPLHLVLLSAQHGTSDICSRPPVALC